MLRTIRTLATVLAMIVGLIVTGAGSAVAVDPVVPVGTLSGIVNDDNGDGYDCASVEIYDAASNPDDDDPVEFTWTDGPTAGAYSVELPVGSYKVHIYDECDEYSSVWVGGNSFANATAFPVTDGATTNVPTVQLDDGAIVSGIVRKSAVGNAPLDAITVNLTIVGELEPLDSATTGVNGAYSFSQLPPGNYQLQYSDPLGEYEPTTRDIVVTSADQGVAPVDLALKPVGVDTNLLKGKVTGPNKLGIPGINVMVLLDDEEEEPVNVRTKRDGTYSANVPVGSYKVYFSEFDEDEGGTYQAEWYDNAPTYYKAKIVTVGATAVTANAELVKNAVIKGKISAPAGYVLDGFVTAYDVDGEPVAGDDVDENGVYSIDGLSPGSYRIKANGWAYDDEEFIDFPLIRQYFAGKYSLAAATPISAGNGAVITGRNMTLSNRLSAYSVPRVTGSAKKNKTLTASPGLWTAMVDIEYKYQWYRGTTLIAGQTARTHKVTAADVGKKLRVVVTASNRYDQYLPGVAGSPYTAKVKKK